MALVEGGTPTKKQQARWQKLYYAQEQALAPAEISQFCLDLYETTEADHLKCGAACQGLSSKTTNLRERGDIRLHPLLDVNPGAARDYCASLGKRLPTLAEWLWAAGGGTEDRKYPWGPQAPSIKRLNGCDFACARIKMDDCGGEDRHCTEREMAEVQGDDGYSMSAPVGSFPAGAGRWGHFDLAGNAAELVAGSAGTRVWWCGSTYTGYSSSNLHERQCKADIIPSDMDGLRCAASAATDRR